MEAPELHTQLQLALLGPDPVRRRGATRFWRQGNQLGWRPNSLPAYQAALSVMENHPKNEVRREGVQALTDWAAALPEAEVAQHLSLALSDPEDMVKDPAFKAARHLPPLYPQLMRIASGEALKPRELPPAESDGTVTYYTAALQDWEAAALALARANHQPARPVLLARPTTPAREVALALLGDSQRLRQPHFSEGHLREAAVEAVVRCQGRHGLAWALNAGHPYPLKAMLLTQNPPGARQLSQAKTPAQLQAWYRQHGRTYLARLPKKASP